MIVHTASSGRGAGVRARRPRGAMNGTSTPRRSPPKRIARLSRSKMHLNRCIWSMPSMAKLSLICSTPKSIAISTLPILTGTARNRPMMRAVPTPDATPISDWSIRDVMPKRCTSGRVMMESWAPVSTIRSTGHPTISLATWIMLSMSSDGGGLPRCDTGWNSKPSPKPEPPRERLPTGVHGLPVPSLLSVKMITGAGLGV
mmetsp:Transcript_35894/g.99518  ORF Transcript_35894/g.99518 Transcript_35894/m.99518 type:complete len:201 (+) Transcript_35894:125-727(+)